jgi:hypothetical protein
LAEGEEEDYASLKLGKKRGARRGVRREAERKVRRERGKGSW